ncbi:MAG: prepilin-type N-terminal cleavage/methylation domain-containing protein [Lentisphaerae bacterium]|jgi:prepilin-type N-terminal cleavage/methylation domain-containing protein|nr:prepilin-type N-terminal cleavage/methylation domain-containing protein [Lentisphaerota bacterium]
MTPSRHNGRAGMTLIEVLLAAALLGLGLVTLLGGLSSCLAVMRAAGEFQQAQWALSLGELAYPVTQVEEVEDLNVDGDSELVEGFTFSRAVDPKEVEDELTDDGLYIVRTRIAWGAGGEGQSEELVSYVWHKGGGSVR